MAQNYNGLNYLTSNRATLQISGLEDVEFSITQFNLPSLTLQYNDVATPFMNAREATSKPDFGDLEITFLVDENIKNWLAVFNWCMDLAFQRTSTPRFAEGKIIVYSSHNNPIVTFRLVGLVPVFISDLNFTEMVAETTPVSATARFAMTYYDVVS
jgi:hypothetical protein